MTYDGIRTLWRIGAATLLGVVAAVVVVVGLGFLREDEPERFCAGMQVGSGGPSTDLTPEAAVETFLDEPFGPMGAGWHRVGDTGNQVVFEADEAELFEIWQVVGRRNSDGQTWSVESTCS